MDQQGAGHSRSKSPRLWSNGDATHSLDVEHRLTTVQIKTAQADQRLSRLEKAVAAILAAMSVLAHDRVPEWAKLLATLIKAI